MCKKAITMIGLVSASKKIFLDVFFCFGQIYKMHFRMEIFVFFGLNEYFEENFNFF